MTNQPKRGPGRPPTRHPLPPPIDASPEEIAEKVLQVKQPKEWQYMKTHKEPTN